MSYRDVILYVGDPHGEIDFILKAAKKYRPVSIIITGDLQFTKLQLDALPCQTIFVHGNHDTDTDEYTHVIDDSKNISSRVVQVRDVRVAGLGGIFRGRSYDVCNEKYPFYSREEKLKILSKHQRVNGGLARKESSSIYPSDIAALEGCTADVLVTHEAPPSYFIRGGFRKISDVAKNMHARTIIHGHHHIDYVEVTDNVTTYGVGKRKILVYDIMTGEYNHEG